jgi:hypothetical protein
MPATYRHIRELIDSELSDGASVRDVEHDLIEPAGLNEEQKAALWLHAAASDSPADFDTAAAALKRLAPLP